jgi:hypothetical protein
MGHFVGVAVELFVGSSYESAELPGLDPDMSQENDNRNRVAGQGDPSPEESLPASQEAWLQAQCTSAVSLILSHEYKYKIEICEVILRRCDKNRHGQYWAWTHYLAGKSYKELGIETVLENELAEKHLKAAAEYYTMDHHLDRRTEIEELIKELRRDEAMRSVWGPVRATTVDAEMCFIMMPFSGESMDNIYEHLIVPVVKSNGLTPKRADSFKSSTSIMDDVWKCIITARVLIADLTDFNANVYYELGMCHALGKMPVLMIQKGHDLPFDLKHFRTIFYSRDFAEAQKAQTNLDEFIKEVLAS